LAVGQVVELLEQIGSQMQANTDLSPKPPFPFGCGLLEIRDDNSHQYGPR